jgi:thiamine-monophosphate kinase
VGQAVQAHLYPEPQCALGRFLSEKGFASSAIDISDGLSTDLAHLCEASGVGARIWANSIPRPEVRNAARSSKEAPLDLALHGGEDYQLLFTVPPRKTAKVPARFRGVPLHHIGEIRQSKELLIIRSDGEKSIIRPLGYDHFRKRM